MASSPGSEWWTACIKPILTASYSSFNKADVPEFAKAIIKCEKDLLEYDDEHDGFYSTFALLSSHYLSANASNVSKATLTAITAASKVLLRYLLKQWVQSKTSLILQTDIMSLIKGLCKGESALSKADVLMFTAILKSARLPPNVKEADADAVLPETKESKRVFRLDTGINVFDELTAVFDDAGMDHVTVIGSPKESVDNDGDTTIVHVPNPKEEMRVLFGKRNIVSLLSLEGSDVILDQCIQLPFLSRFILRYKEATEGTAFTMPSTLSEALTLKNSYRVLLADVSVVWNAFSLPILEPLTPQRLEKIVGLTLSCLYAAISVTTANTIINLTSTVTAKGAPITKEDDADGTKLIQKTLEIFNNVSAAIRESTRAGGNFLQNFNMMAAWLLLKGLQGILSLTPSLVLERRDSTKGKVDKPDSATQKTKESLQPRPSSAKSFQGFDVLSVALASTSIQLLSKLLDDSQVEGAFVQEFGTATAQGMDATILSSLTAWQRVRKLTSRINLIDLLLNLVTVSYKKACVLKKLKQGSESSESSGSSTSDSNTYYEDDFSSSDNSSVDVDEEDDDSEPILGQWFEETLSPVEPDVVKPPPPAPILESSIIETKKSHSNGGDGPNFVPDKKEPAGFVSLAADILNFLTGYFVNSPNGGLQKLLKASLTEEHMSGIAMVIKEMDKDCVKSGQYTEFEMLSIALAKFSHSLIAKGAMSEKLQASLLTNLGVNSASVDPWPLTIYPRTLAVLAEMILLKQQRERETKAVKCQSEADIINIWMKVINTITAAIVNFDNKTDAFEDINVEHYQLLLLFFHGLSLLQKKSLVLELGNKIIRIASLDTRKLEQTVPLPLSRLLLVFDYLLHYFYDPPTELLAQVQWNLFSMYNSRHSSDGDGGKMPLAKYFSCREVEDSFRKNLSNQEAAEVGIMKPRFYSLGPTSINNQDAPKVDGLVCSFLLSNSDKLNYGQLYDSCIRLLMAGSQCDKAQERLSLLDAAAMHYHFLIGWRLLACLPPSSQFMELLSSGTVQLANGNILHTLRVAPRLGQKTYFTWMLDHLVKQGMTTQQADALLNKCNKAINCVEYDMRLAMSFITKQISTLPVVAGRRDVVPVGELPGLSTILILDAVVAKVQVSLDEAFSNTKTDTDTPKLKASSQDLIPAIFSLIDTYGMFVRSCILGRLTVTSAPSPSGQQLKAYSCVMSIASGRAFKILNLDMDLLSLLPPMVKSAVDKWNDSAINEFPRVGAWRFDFSNEILPCENYIDAIHSAHISSLSSQSQFTINTAIRHLLQALVRFSGDLVSWCEIDTSNKEIVRVMFPLVTDVATDYLADMIFLSLERFLGPVDGEEFQKKVCSHFVSACQELIIEQSSAECGLDEKILQECLKFMESFLDKPAGKKAFEEFYTESADLSSLLLSATRENLSLQFGTQVLKFFVKLFQLAEKSPNDKSYEALCGCLQCVLDKSTLRSWLHKMIMPTGQGAELIEEGDDSAAFHSIKQKMEQLKKDILKETSEREAMVKMKDIFVKTPALGDPTVLESKIVESALKLDSLNQEVRKCEPSDDGLFLTENRALLQKLMGYMVKDKSLVGDAISQSTLTILMPMATDLLTSSFTHGGFPELMLMMRTLAGAGQGNGHMALFESSTQWLGICKSYLTQKDVIEKIQENVKTGKHQSMSEALCCLLGYIGEILAALKRTSERNGSTSPMVESELNLAHETELDWPEDASQDDEDSAAEDSDEDSLNNKLCTFTITQKEFTNQHWYHCHTCKMVDGVGVCTTCARVCHKDHDITYAKFSSFFCDCGAKEDSSCQALVKRSSQTGLKVGNVSAPSPFSMDTMLPSSLRRRMSSPGPDKGHESSSSHSEQKTKVREALYKQIERCREKIISCLSSSNAVQNVLEFLDTLLPSISEMYQSVSPIRTTVRAQKALDDLHTQAKNTESTDQLMTVTLGSQEGAFENVRMNYSGDRWQTIRMLINKQLLRRVAMCVLSSPHGKRQHLAVCHEKGKITILQLSALLKQADSSKKKLTLTRLASAPIPFTVLSITGNPANEDYLAVCGLKDCHVLTFNSLGSVADHLVLHQSCAIGNFISKAVWLPGSQTEIAIVTADYIKIYDLAMDALSPQYYFLLPSGKIRDATFIFSEEKRHLVLMSASGYIYAQIMEDASSAKHGPFYITGVLEVTHTDLKDSSGQVAGGGVSVYYSHTLQLMFFSYTQGKSFIAPVAKDLSQVTNLFPVTYKSANGSGKGNNGPQPLVQWSEVYGHTGLVCCMAQTSNIPVVLMVKPDAIFVQELKVVPAKAKIQDVVAIRHQASNSDQQRTTMILLCDDGSLRIYMANEDQTNYWLSPFLQPQSPISVLKPAKKKKATKAGRPTSSVSFSVDFFEHCQVTNDIEFGGNDILQIYNTQQIKHRLNASGMYIASTKPICFSIEITNTNTSNVMVGLRVMVGSQTADKSPSYLEVFGRSTQVSTTRSRWIDLPFTRDESLTADKKLTLFVAASVDPSGATMVDSIKVYVKSKESFGWPEETEDILDTAATVKVSTTSCATTTASETVTVSQHPHPISATDKLLTSALEVLDGAFSALPFPDEKDPSCQSALKLATELLTLPTPTCVQQHTKALMSSLFTTKLAFHNHKDQAQLVQVMRCLNTDGQTNPDVESFQRLVVTARAVAVARPQNIVKFAETSTVVTPDEGSSSSTASLEDKVDVLPRDSSHFVSQLADAFWKLHAAKPANLMLAPVCLPGLAHIEATVIALVEIIHAFTLCDFDNASLATKHYVRLLLCPDPMVSFACKQAMIRVLRPHNRRRKVFIPSPPRCSSPGGVDVDDDDDDDDEHDTTPKPATEARPQSDTESQDQYAEDEPYEVVDDQGEEPMVLEPDDPGHPNPLEVLLAGGVNFPPIVDIPPDADDETMVELAIALSLQEQSGHGSGLNLQGFGLPGNVQSIASLEEGHLSDNTASAPGSDDEIGSNAATDGSTLRTSPAEHAGSAGSESGGSVIDSISVSGRSSAYGDAAPESATTGARSETSSYGIPSSSLHQETMDTDTDYDATCRLHSLRLMLLERLVQHLPEVRDVGGVRVIPFIQVILVLTSDLDGEEDKDRAALDNLLTKLLVEVDLRSKDLDNIGNRTRGHEVKLVLLRLLSVLLSRFRVTNKPSSECISSSFLSNGAATAMLSNDAVDFCLIVLKQLLPYWKQFSTDEEEDGSLPGQLLKPHATTPTPDMLPFFLRQYVKSHSGDVFVEYPMLLTEIVLRLPYQLKKISDSVSSVQTAVFDLSWHSVLAEYLMTHQTTYAKKHVRKLLLFICGSKEKYRQLRDLHSLSSHIKSVMELCQKGGLDTSDTIQTGTIVLQYDTLLSLIDHLKICSDIACSRSSNWQLFCQRDPEVLPFLIKASIALDDGVAPVMLQLLQCALCGTKNASPQSSGTSIANSSPAKQKKEKEQDKEKTEDAENDDKPEASLCAILVQQVNKVMNIELLAKFTRAFLLESNLTSIRWQAHSLILHIYRSSIVQQQDQLIDLMWGLWKELPLFGRKATQFVDLLGYFVLKVPSSEQKIKDYLEKAVCVLRDENQLLANHPNGTIYNMLQGLVDFDGYYLESDPCLVCNNPEVNLANLKLSAIKVDSKFTTSTQIVKLVGSHTISKISLRISDLKRTKMVRNMNIYYNNRTVQAVVELKNKPGMWHKAKKVTLATGQTDVKVEFPIPIVACNLMIEYAEFYDNLQATAETLQCPRCSASVPAHPGVCSNCGENVFQCHKCRSINYDEKDPFLCNACGFCKYAKFDFTLMAKPCCAVDPIENDEDRKKSITTINNLLEKADRIYKQLQLHRPALEILLIQVTEHGSDRHGEEAVPGGGVNKSIQQLALKYCGESKSSFDELSKITQKVLACRKELVDYDRQQREAVMSNALITSTLSSRESNSELLRATEHAAPSKKITMKVKDSLKASNCFGCASATVEHCITLLRALVTNPSMRQVLCEQGMIKELIDYNLRRGTLAVRNDVRSLLCMLTKDSQTATEEMNLLVMSRILTSMKGYLATTDMGATVRHEILLLASSVHQEDTCWEQRVRCVMKLFLLGMEVRSPVIMDSVTLPCLRIMQHLVKPDTSTMKKQDKQTGSPLVQKQSSSNLHVNTKQWLLGDEKYSYQSWKQQYKGLVQYSASPQKKEDKASMRANYLMEKYGNRWLENMWKVPTMNLRLARGSWLRQAMFSPSSRSARQTACSIILSVCTVQSRKKEVIDTLTSYLDDIGTSGECATEYLALYMKLISSVEWKNYLAIKGVLLHLGDLITKEVEHLDHLEDTTLSSDLAQGFALKALTELLALFVEQDHLKQHYKSQLVGFVLNGYLTLRKLVVQRTKVIDETQDKLLELLEELTTGTESETKKFMLVCVQTVKKYPLDDFRSPVFIFERLCSIIFPEENDTGEFFMILEKDPQQEDFLQGRMLGNPYSSNEPGLGPLMRDVKNKICQDCELVAFLEDDTGMELLVNKKIISLDLPVKEVHKKIWAPEHGEGDPMPIIYRMRGLLGDATEDMVNSLDMSTEEDVDKEEVYKMANVLNACGGLEVMLQRLTSIKDLVLGKQLMIVLLKLFGYAVNVKANRQELIKPELHTITIMLGALNLALWAEQESGTSATKGQTITEQILQIMELILSEASSHPPEIYKEFSELCGDKDQLMMLLDRINSPFVRANTSVLQALMKLIPFLAFGEDDKMAALINHFKPYLDFNKFDFEHSHDEQIHLDCFCVIANGIESNANGGKLKDMILEHDIVQMAVEYVMTHAPQVTTLLPSDSEHWKDFLSRPALSYSLRLLTGLCNGHIPTQNLVGAKLVPILHKLEQVSSDKHIGTVAENLLEALRVNGEVADKIEDVRQQTKSEKKRLAMAKRKKQLGALGMTTNEKGQVTVKSSVMKQMEELKEESGLTCCICREGYRYQPQKVLAVYTFTKRANLDDFDNKARKSVGYSTVSHFNVIHADCHTAAVRHARGREEWESAALQNANTKCNGLLPLWGPQVQESAFATCLARHNTYLQECSGVRDPSYPFTIHDMKLLLLRFAQEKPFSDDAGGGGRQSNLYLIPHMMHITLYVINTTRSTGREEKNLTNFLETSHDKWLEKSYETEGALYWTIMSIHILKPEQWRAHRRRLLEQLIVLAHARHVSASCIKTLGDKTMKDYAVYKWALLFFGLANGMYEKLYKRVTVMADTPWTSSLADYIRNNDGALIEACDRLLAAVQDEMMPCESITEFLDVTGMLEDIVNPGNFIPDLLASFP